MVKGLSALITVFFIQSLALADINDYGHAEPQAVQAFPASPPDLNIYDSTPASDSEKGQMHISQPQPFRSFSTSSSPTKLYEPKVPGTFFILSIDGGGIRGLIPGIIVREMEKQLGVKVSDIFDMVVGTSTGGLLGLFFATGNTAAEAVEIYKSLGSTIFQKPLTRQVRSLGGLISSKYSAKPLEAELKRIFGNRRLTDLKIPSVFTSYDIRQKNLFTFFSEEAKFHPSLNIELWKVGRATSAAPIYFKPFILNLVGQGGFSSGDIQLVDGGLVANTPGILGYIRANEFWEGNKIVVISIGTGRARALNQLRVSGKSVGGVLQMLLPTIEGFQGAQQELTAYIMRKVLPQSGSKYYRLAPFVQEKTALDNISPKNLSRLEEAATTYTRTDPKFQDVINLLKERVSRVKENNPNLCEPSSLKPTQSPY